MGNWIKLKATAMEIDDHLEMLAVTKSISLLLDLLNLGVEPYTDAISPVLRQTFLLLSSSHSFSVSLRRKHLKATG
jgi:hypothetical protein